MKALSASRISTYNSCSWKYWCNYHLKLPSSGNDGSSRGTICHLIFEVLGRRNEKRDSIVRKMLGDKTIKNCPSICRLVKKHAKYLGVCDKVNLLMIDEMIITGLGHDFYGESIGDPIISLDEKLFDITKQDGEYSFRVKGFIDKLFIYKMGDDTIALIRDFKTSKEPYSNEEVDFNLQNYIYTFAVRTLYPEVTKDITEFLFLRHDLSSSGRVVPDHIDENKMLGFYSYMTQMQHLIDSFDATSSVKNFAKDRGYPEKDAGFKDALLCGFAKVLGQKKKDGTDMFACEYKFPRVVWKVLDKNTEEVNRSYEFIADDITPDFDAETEVLKKVRYNGCPKFRKARYGKKIG